MPVLAALPLALGDGGSATAALLASLAARHGWLRGAVILPEAFARDLALAVLAVGVVLQVAAGFAVRRFLLRLAPQAAATAGGLVFALSPVFAPAGLGAGSPWLGCAAPLLLIAAERLAAPRVPGDGGVAGTCLGLLSLALFGVAPLVLASGLAASWAVARIATRPAGRRGAALRFAACTLFGVVIAWPVAAAVDGFAASFAGRGGAVFELSALGAWLAERLGDLPAHDALRVARALAATLAPMLGILPAALLGLAGRRGAALRAALGFAFVATLLGTAARLVGLRDAAPLLLLPLALLGGVAVADAARGAPAAPILRIAAAITALALALWVLRLGTPHPATCAIGAAAALAVTAAAARPRPLALLLPLAVWAGAVPPVAASVGALPAGW